MPPATRCPRRLPIGRVPRAQQRKLAVKAYRQHRMSSTFLLSLAAVVASLLVVRLLLPGLPVESRAVRLSFTEGGVVVGGVTVLAFHCAAMFFTSLAELVPGTTTAIDDIQALGNTSLAWYALPAVSVVLGLRRLPRGALSVVVLALVSIGFTMYNSGPLSQHLFTLWTGMVILAAVLSTLVRPPTRTVRSQPLN